MKDYGEKVDGFDEGVLNDREVRAAAGLMFMFGMIVIFVGVGYGHTFIVKYYLSLVFFDLTVRIINPSYSPFMLLGRFFVQNQKPEYVGAIQKRFAWILGWVIFLPMMNWFVLHWDITFYKVLLCVLCLSVIFLESAFGICVGCKIYTLFTGEKSKNCPGGSCELVVKEPIQTFSPIQKVITAVMMIGLLAGTYLFIATAEPKTFFGEFLHELVLTKEQLKAEEDKKLQAQEAEFDTEDDF